ncbi:MAG: peptidoglycan-binding domain-containing protein [Promethearchaeota archaeon]|jgi:hypothetical protein
MNKKVIIITVSSLALVGAGVGLFFYFRNKNKETKREESEEEEEYGATKDVIEEVGGAVGTADESEYSAKSRMEGASFPLKVGSKGKKVAILQAMLNEVEGQSLTVDGSFGNDTRYALLKSGFLKCGVAKYCEVSSYAFGELANEIKDKKKFASKFASSFKKVTSKYSSANGIFAKSRIIEGDKPSLCPRGYVFRNGMCVPMR